LRRNLKWEELAAALAEMVHGGLLSLLFYCSSLWEKIILLYKTAEFLVLT
jgi:hypothetical protein